MKNQQLELLHDSFREALRAVALSYGGGHYKKMGAELWPTITTPEKAGQKLADCLNESHTQKLDLEEAEYILKKGREIGIHYGMHYLTNACGYEDPKPTNPETEKEKLQRDFIKATESFKQLMKKMEALNA